MSKNKLRKVAFSTIAASTAVAAVAPAVAADSVEFPDVKPGNDGYGAVGVFYQPIMALAEKGIVSGDSGDGGKFKPWENVVRGQVAKMLTEAQGLPIPEDIGEALSVYEDVGQNNDYAEYIAATTEAGIFTGSDGQFMEYDDLTREQMAAVLVRAFDLEELNEDVEDVAVNLDQVSEGFEEDIQIIANLGITTELSDFRAYDKINRAQFAAFLHRTIEVVEEANKQVETAVEGLTAVDAKTLAVEFNDEISQKDLEELTFDVERNGVTTLFEVDSVKDNSVYLVRSTGTNLQKGSYKVTVEGLSEGANATAEVEVEDQALAEMEISIDGLLTGAKKANLGIKALDQYGTDMGLENDADYTVTAKNLTKDTTFDVPFDPVDNFFYLDTTQQNSVTGQRAFDLGDQVQVTVVHNDTGISTTKTVEVTEAATLSEIDFGEPVLPAEAERLSDELEDVKIPYEAKDQYGNSIDLFEYLVDEDGEVIGQLRNVTFGTSDSKILDSDNVTLEKDDDGNTFIVIEQFEGFGDVVLRVVSQHTGEVFNYELEVLQRAGQVNAIELGKSTVDIAEGKTDQVAVDVTVTDSYGNKLEPKNYLNADYTINTSNSSVAEAAFDRNTESDTYGQLLITPKPNAEEGDTAKIDVQINKTEEKASLDVSISERAVLSSVSIDEDFNSNLVRGTDTEVEFKLLDQYDDEIALPDGHKIRHEVSDEDILKVEYLEEDQAFSVKAEKVGEADLTINVENADGDVVVSKIVSFDVVPNTSEELDYDVVDIPTLYKNGSSASLYAQEIKVVGLDNGGNELVVPQSEIVNVKSSDPSIADVENTDDGWVVFGNVNSNSDDSDDIDEDKTVTLTVQFNNDAGVSSIEKEVTVSKDELQASSVEFYKGLDDAGLIEEGELNKDAEAASTVNFANASNIFVVVQDQFDVYSEADNNIDLKVANVRGIEFTNDTVGLTNEGALDLSSLEGTVTDLEEASFRVVATADSGKSGFIDVTVNEDDLTSEEQEEETDEGNN